MNAMRRISHETYANVFGVVYLGLMTNALLLSYTRVPYAMAVDGLLPRVLTRLHPKTGAPWVAILVCAFAWCLCLPLGFEKLILLDIMIYGIALLLEFVALVVLRVREPRMPRCDRAMLSSGHLPSAWHRVRRIDRAG